MGLEELSLGGLIKEIVSREIHKIDFSRSMYSPGRRPFEFERSDFESERSEKERKEKYLEALYSELSRREKEYRKD